MLVTTYAVEPEDLYEYLLRDACYNECYSLKACALIVEDLNGLDENIEYDPELIKDMYDEQTMEYFNKKYDIVEPKKLNQFEPELFADFMTEDCYGFLWAQATKDNLILIKKYNV